MSLQCLSICCTSFDCQLFPKNNLVHCWFACCPGKFVYCRCEISSKPIGACLLLLTLSTQCFELLCWLVNASVYLKLTANPLPMVILSSVGKKLAWEKSWPRTKLAEFIQFSCLVSGKTFRIHLVLNEWSEQKVWPGPTFFQHLLCLLFAFSTSTYFLID